MNAAPRRATAAAKINLALVVGPRRADGYHEVATVMQRIDLCDRLELEPGTALEVLGFRADTLIRDSLLRLAQDADVEPAWRVRLRKEIPVAAGLGGGSADAAAALVLANESLTSPRPAERLHRIALSIGSDVPFFLTPGPKLAEGRGERLTQLELPQDYWVVVALDRDAVKRSTAYVYARFDEVEHGPGFEERRESLLTALAACTRARDLSGLPPNDLAVVAAETQLSRMLGERGAFRADVSGAGPAVYGLFHDRADAISAAADLPRGTRSWVAPPVW